MILKVDVQHHLWYHMDGEVLEKWMHFWNSVPLPETHIVEIVNLHMSCVVEGRAGFKWVSPLQRVNEVHNRSIANTSQVHHAKKNRASSYPTISLHHDPQQRSSVTAPSSRPVCVVCCVSQISTYSAVKMLHLQKCAMNFTKLISAN